MQKKKKKKEIQTKRTRSRKLFSREEHWKTRTNERDVQRKITSLSLPSPFFYAASRRESSLNLENSFTRRDDALVLILCNLACKKHIVVSVSRLKLWLITSLLTVLTILTVSPIPSSSNNREPTRSRHRYSRFVILLNLHFLHHFYYIYICIYIYIFLLSHSL